ncbi:SpoIIE family protein phosphatase [Thermoactinospora rubra]|uniref:SpoIIE family protein phosphatase n=1 Tax=Thermoactinospora rubra TaxID=1088767 RepID=UPI000A0F5062|nr:SpoIIE family protein phosphatase [Thermoactinospora rubra]
MLTTEVRVDHESAAAEAAGLARRAARRLGLAAPLAERAAVAASELASNIDKHTRGGSVFVQRAPGGGLDLLAADHGPGMADVARCLTDGYSTAGTLGGGLGAVRRLASAFAVFSAPAHGTAIAARFRDEAALDLSRLEAGAVCLPANGHQESGDAYELAGGTLLVVDGLGHGAEAARASASALDAFRADPEAPLTELIVRLDRALRSSRGAAASLVRLRAAGVEFCGVGNVGGAVLHDGRPLARLVPRPGTLGVRAGGPVAQTAPMPPGATVVLHTDGISHSWLTTSGTWLFTQPPPLLAALLARDHRRLRDDATAVALRDRRS